MRAGERGDQRVPDGRGERGGAETGDAEDDRGTDERGAGDANARSVLGADTGGDVSRADGPSDARDAVGGDREAVADTGRDLRTRGRRLRRGRDEERGGRRAVSDADFL